VGGGLPPYLPLSRVVQAFYVRTPRRRTPVRTATLRLLRPLFRYSAMREAYVLRLIGRSFGPVLVERRD